jgi:hypothetical protein
MPAVKIHLENPGGYAVIGTGNLTWALPKNFGFYGASSIKSNAVRRQKSSRYETC